MLKILFWLKLDFTKDLPLKLYYFLSQKKKSYTTFYKISNKAKAKGVVTFSGARASNPIPSKEVDA